MEYKISFSVPLFHNTVRYVPECRQALNLFEVNEEEKKCTTALKRCRLESR